MNGTTTQRNSTGDDFDISTTFQTTKVDSSPEDISQTFKDTEEVNKKRKRNFFCLFQFVIGNFEPPSPIMRSELVKNVIPFIGTRISSIDFYFL